AEALAARQRAQRREKIIRMVLFAALGVGLFWFFFVRGQGPSEINGHPIREFSSTGVNEHVAGTVAYETSPPVSGPHAGTPAQCGVHSEQIPNENQVHSLEHGAVGLQYSPDLDPESIRTLEEIAGEFDKDVFSAPYDGIDRGNIAVTSWGRAMYLDELDEVAVRDYIDVFAGEGPEAGQECPSTVDSPFQPAEATPSPGATTETPHDDSEDHGDGGTPSP
ncbi:MAG TPA: DUF3105 domain-containing protein, partial [Actinomycetota bacterium]|nr:DUF3105 domain-containing protein [Actinomycetota bacterium]